MTDRSIKLWYRYRDAGNNKNHGTVVFKNDTGLSLALIDACIRERLIDGLWFVAENWDLPGLYFEHYERNELDHDWHEYDEVEETDKKGLRSLQQFLECIAAND